MSNKHIEISSEEFLLASERYWELVSQLPDRMQRNIPSFQKFLSPANFTHFRSDPIELSITGTERYQWLQSPYALTLLAMYAARRFDKNNEGGYEM